MLGDIRYAIRTMWRAPGFTVVAVLALAIGIGANTAIFSVIRAVLLRPLPYADPGRLVIIQETIPKLGDALPGVPAPDTLDFQNQTRSFDGVAAFQNESLELSGRGAPEQIQAARVSAGVFQVLGVQPSRGRSFSPEDDQPGHQVAIISYGLWQRDFGGDENIIGQTATLSRKNYQIVGVMPPSFTFPTPGLSFAEPADLWVPMAFSQDELADRGDDFNYSVVARLKPGVTIAQASGDVNTVAGGILELFPPEIRAQFQLSAAVVPLQDLALGRVQKLLWLLLGAVGLVLLIACANVANLLLARAVDRQKEVAIRVALGAGRSRLIRQFITESILLALVGGGAGLLLASWGASALASLAPATIPRANQIGLDSLVIAFTFGLSLLTGLVFGVVPAFAASASRLNEALKEGGRNRAPGSNQQRLRNLVVISEVALATVLLAGAGLLIRSFIRVRNTDPGFKPEGVLSMSVTLPSTAYGEAARVRSFYTDLLDQLRATRGVNSAGLSTDLPTQATWTHLFTPEGYNPPDGAALNTCKNSLVLGDYFKSLGIPLIRGRGFDERDGPGSPLAVIISRSIADRFYPDTDPIGKRLKWGPVDAKSPWLVIVGVVGDVKPAALDQDMQPHTYEPFLQSESEMMAGIAPNNIVIKFSGSAEGMTAQVRDIVAKRDNQLAVDKVRTLTFMVDRSIAPRRFNTFLLTVFAASALLLSAIGIYGVIAYSVTQREHEIGVRMALGARPGDVVKMVLRQGGRLAGIGIAAGLVGALGLTRLLSSLLYQSEPFDPVTMAAVALVLAAVAFLASYIPARRSTRIDPAIALRFE